MRPIRSSTIASSAKNWNLAAHGRYHFTTDDALEAIGGSGTAVRAQLRRLKNRVRIASPMRSFHVIAPPEYQRLGCLPAEHFVDQLDLADALAPFVEKRARSHTPLRRAEDVAGADRNPRWKLLVNVDVEPDT